MPKQAKTELYPPWKELYDTYKEAPYGAFLSFNDISQKIRIRPYNSGWTWTIERFKKELLCMSNRALESIRNKGYRIVNPNEHTRLSYREGKRAERRLKSGIEILKHVDVALLNDIELKQLTDMQARVGKLYGFMLIGARQLKKITFHYDLPTVPRPQLNAENELVSES